MKKKLTKPQTRVAIAKDAIKQVKAGKMKPAQNGYVNFSKLVQGDLQKGLSEVKKCTVCELGGLFVSTVRLFNDFIVEEKSRYMGNKDIAPKLLKYFSARQLSMMETAFEGTEMAGAGTYAIKGYTVLSKLSGTAQDKCIEFGAQYKRTSDRFIAICKNIIKNNGTFKPQTQ